MSVLAPRRDKIRHASAPASCELPGRGHHLVRGDRMAESSTPHRPSTSVNLLRCHGSPTRYLYRHGCRCIVCRAGQAEYSRGVREAHHKALLECQRRSYRRNRDAKMEYGRFYRASHPGTVAEYSRRWREAHPQEAAEAQRRYRAGHKAQSAANSRNRRARKRKAAGSHTAANVAAQRTRQRGLCYWCGGKVGRHYHADHVIPLVLGGSNGPENLVIACADCNLSKGAKHPMDFAGRLL